MSHGNRAPKLPKFFILNSLFTLAQTTLSHSPGYLVSCRPNHPERNSAGYSAGNLARNPASHLGCNSAEHWARNLPGSSAGNLEGHSAGNSAGDSADCEENHRGKNQESNWESNLQSNGADYLADSRVNCLDRNRASHLPNAANRVHLQDGLPPQPFTRMKQAVIVLFAEMELRGESD